jgi:hypothetical protein
MTKKAILAAVTACLAGDAALLDACVVRIKAQQAKAGLLGRAEPAAVRWLAWAVSRVVRLSDSERGSNVGFPLLAERACAVGIQWPLIDFVHWGSVFWFDAVWVASGRGRLDSYLMRVAAEGRNLSMVRALFDRGFSLSEWGHEFHEALARRVLPNDWDSADILVALLEAGLDPNCGRCFPLLSSAVNEAKSVAARVLIEAGADVRFRHPSSGETALHFARTREVVDLLCDNGADPLARDKDGRTPYEKLMGLRYPVDVLHAIDDRGGKPPGSA